MNGINRTENNWKIKWKIIGKLNYVRTKYKDTIQGEYEWMYVR